MYFSLTSHSAKSLVEAFYQTVNMQCIIRHKKSKTKTKQKQPFFFNIKSQGERKKARHFNSDGGRRCETGETNHDER